jgi:hypothetical protein
MINDTLPGRLDVFTRQALLSKAQGYDFRMTNSGSEQQAV